MALLSDNDVFGDSAKPVLMSDDDVLGAKPKKQNKGIMADIGTDLKRGVQSLPGIVTGVVDMVTAPITGDTYANKAANVLGDITGFQPSKWKEEAAQEYSPERVAASEAVNKAWDENESPFSKAADGDWSGVGNIAKAYAQNPRHSFGQVVESLPPMLAGGVAGRAIAGATKLNPLVGGAIGEGSVMAGSQMDQLTEEGADPRIAAAASLATGVVGTALGVGGGKLAQKIGVVDPETALAGGASRSVAGEAADKGIKAAVVDGTKRVAGGAVSEGFFEEMPQSMLEQALSNLALGKDWQDGIDRAAVEGAIAGSMMGGAFNLLPGRQSDNVVQDTPAAEETPASPLLALPAPTYTGTPGDQLVVNDAARQAAIDAADANAAALYAAREQFERDKATGFAGPVNIVTNPEPIQQRIDALLGVNQDRLKGVARTNYEKAIDNAFNEQIGYAVGKDGLEVPVTIGDYLASKVATGDIDRNSKVAAKLSERLNLIAEQNATKLQQLAEEESTQQPDIAAPSIPVIGPISAAANVAVKTGAAAPPAGILSGLSMGVESNVAKPEQVAQEAAQANEAQAGAEPPTAQKADGVTPTPGLLASRTPEQLSYLAQNGQGGRKEEAIAELARRGIPFAPQSGSEPPKKQTKAEAKKTAKEMFDGAALDARRKEVAPDSNALSVFAESGKEAEFLSLLRRRKEDKSSLSEDEESRFFDLRTERNNALAAVENAAAQKPQLADTNVSPTNEGEKPQAIETTTETKAPKAKEPKQEPPTFWTSSTPAHRKWIMDASGMRQYTAMTPWNRIKPEHQAALIEQWEDKPANQNPIKKDAESDSKANQLHRLKMERDGLFKKVRDAAQDRLVADMPSYDQRKTKSGIARLNSIAQEEQRKLQSQIDANQEKIDRLSGAPETTPLAESEAYNAVRNELSKSWEAKYKDANGNPLPAAAALPADQPRAETVTAPGQPEAGNEINLDTSKPVGVFKSGDEIRVRGKDDKVETVDSVGGDGWVYTMAGGAWPPEKIGLLYHTTGPRKQSLGFPGLGSIESNEDAEPATKPTKADADSEPTASTIPMPSRDDPQFEKKNTLRQLQNALAGDTSPSGKSWANDLQTRASYEKSVSDLEAELSKPTGAEQSPEQSDQFAGNKIFTADKVAAAKARLKKKLGTLNSGIDPELLIDGMTIAGAYIESGVRKFSDYAKAMVDDLGDSVKPYLLSFYEAARAYPGLDKEGMDSQESAAKQHQAMLETPEVSTKLEDKGEQSAPATESTTGEKRDGTQTDQQGDPALAGMAAEQVQGATGGEPVGDGSGSSSDRGSEGDQKLDGSRGETGRSGGSGAAAVDTADTGRAGAGRGRGGRAGGLSGRSSKNGKAEAGAGDVPTVTAADIPAIPEVNFEITEDVGLGSGGQMTKYRDNVAAIKVLKALEAERRRATAAEKKILARYVGWGGIPNAFRNGVTGKVHPEWEKEVAEIESLLTPKELRAASASTRNAHYTAQSVVNFMWGAVKKMGFGGGLVLEPSVGTGNFVGLMPKELAGKSFVTGIELDSLTSRIAGALYPKSSIINTGFQKAALPSNRFKLVIGNPPFGSESLRFQFRPELNGASIHNQFFLGGLDSLEPGGILTMVVSRYLLDAKDATSREKLAIDAQMLGAIRLPGSAFKGNALTDVVTDVIFLRKRTPEDAQSIREAFFKRGKPPKSSDAKATAEYQSQQRMLETEMRWTKTGEVKDPLGGEPMVVSQHFVDRPGQIIGTMDRSGSMREGGDINVTLPKGEKLEDRLNAMLDRIQQVPTQSIGDEALANIEKFHKAMGESLRLTATGAEADAISFDQSGNLTTTIERVGQNGETALSSLTITPSTPWSAQLQMDLDGNWFREVVKTDKNGKPVKAVDGNGKPTSRNIYERQVFKKESDVPKTLMLGETAYAKMKQLIGIRDLFIKQIELEVGRAPSGVMEANRAALRDAYKEFTDKHGFISDRKNASIISDMPDEGLLMSLEMSYKPEVTESKAKRTGMSASPASAKPAAILSRPVAIPPADKTRADTPADALAISLSESGRVDIARIASLRDMSEEAATEELTSGDAPLAFKDPENGNALVEKGAYLSGNVRRKLQAAKQAGLSGNIKALEAVQPEAWSSDKVTARVGSNWIPAEVYGEFASELIGSTVSVSYSKLTNTFEARGERNSAAATATWGTKRVSAVELFNDILNSRSTRVTDSRPDGSPVFNQVETDAANDKRKEIVEAFDNWIFKDADRRAMLTRVFNDTFNTRVTPQYDGSHMMFPGKVPDEIISLRRGQVNAVWRGIIDNAVLYDHAVGAGKTFTGIARAMERRRMGLSKKPMVVVPNHMVGEWAAQAYRLYPGARVLAATKKDLESKNRRRLFAKIASGDWDMVIVPHSSFQLISISPETEERLLSAELDSANAALAEAIEDAEPGTRFKPLSVKAAEALIEKIEKRLDAARGRLGKDRLLTFEQMGVDDLTIDESHEFKNLFYSSNLSDVRGMGNKQGSDKAFDLYSKTRVIREVRGSLAFLTGTPISNSAVEAYNILRYLAPESLKESGLESFDAFRAMYVDSTAKFEPTDSGGSLKLVTRLGRSWSNMRSLMELYYSIADVVTNDDIKRWYAEDNPGKEFPLPKVKSGDRIPVSVKATPTQMQLLNATIADFEALDRIEDIRERNAERLRLMDRARKLSLHAKAVDPSLSDEPGGKLDKVADKVSEIYRRESKNKGTQLVFLDRGVPKSKGDDKIIKEYDELRGKLRQASLANNEEDARKLIAKLEKFDANEMEELRAAQSNPWSGYQHIKDRLIEQGVPANEIAFVQSFNGDAAKEQLFQAVRDGTIRVLIGSTPRMGAGTNVQERLVALHHVDATWKPSDIEQREGRIIRQGNMFATPPTDAQPNLMYRPGFEVEIYAYVTERTVDAKLWDLNATKLRMINAIRYYDGQFEMDFDDDAAIGMAEIAAIASGDPLLLERFKLTTEVDNLHRSKRSHRRRIESAEDSLREAKRKVENAPAEMAESKEDAGLRAALNEAINADIATRSLMFGGKRYSFAEATMMKMDYQKFIDGIGEDEKFHVEIGGKEYTSKAAAEEAINAAFGDIDPFVAEVDGNKIIRRSDYARAIREKIGTEIPENGTIADTPMGTIGGIPVSVSIENIWGGPSIVLGVSGKYESTGRRRSIIGYRSLTPEKHKAGEPVQLSVNALRPAISGFLESVSYKLDNSARIKQAADKAEKEIPVFDAQVSEPFKGQGELDEKTARLSAVEAELSSRKAAEAPKEDAQNEGVGNIASSGMSPADKAIYGMAAEGKSAADILKFIASASRSPFNRQVAKLLLKTGIAPKITVGDSKGWKFNAGEGNKYAAAYNQATDTVALFRPAAAERNMLHEMVHAATIRALGGKGMAAGQMKVLFNHVKKTGKLRGMYGMSDIDEFIAEAFSNPKFQDRLKTVSAASMGGKLSTAWDWFIRVVRGILGLPSSQDNALSQALQIGLGVMRDDMALRKNESGVPFAEITGQEVDKALGRNLQEKATNWMRGHLQGKSFRNDSTGWDISVGRKGINKSMMHAAKDVHSRSVAAIPDLLKNAILVASEENRNVEERKSVPLVHHLYAPLRIDGADYIARLVVKEARDGTRFYDYETSNEISPAVPGKFLPFTQRMGNSPSARLNMSMAELLSYVKKEHGGTDPRFVRYNIADDGWSVADRAKDVVMRLAGRPMADPSDPFAAENARLREQDQSLWSKAKKQMRRYLAPGGLLPQSVFAEKIKRDSEFQAVEFDVRHLIGGLEHAVKADFGIAFDKLSKEQMQPITEALAGNVPASLPAATKTAAIAMRQYIDGMSTEYLKIIQEKIDAKMLKAIESGKDADKAQAINEIELFEKIKGNIGRYVHRSYQAFDDPKWFEKVPASVLNASRLYLKQGYMEAGETDAKAAQLAEVTLHEILKNGTAYDSMESFIAESKLGAKDLSVLMRRKEVPAQIRALLGEYPDARLNFTKSATKMGRLIWNTRFLDRVRDIGMGSFFFDGKDRPPAATTQIAADGSEVYAPLNGLWTFPEIAQAFKDALGKEQMSDLYRAIVRANGLVKYGKTVLSPTTAMRNWQSAMFFSLANGHFDLTQMKKSISAFREQVSQQATGGDLKYLRHLKRLGVVYDTPYAGEMARLMEDARMEELLSSKKGDAVRWFRKANQMAQGFYTFGDDFWKIIGFENEKAGLMKAGLTPQEAEVEAAKRIRDTYPTYSMVGRGVQWLSRFPLAGTFVSFPAEIIRTSANMLRTVASDLKSDNPKLRELGMKRAAGLAFVSAAFYGLSALSMAMAGVGDDEDEAIRDLAPEWSKNSTFLYLGRDENGNLRYFDLTFLDPYGYFKRPITAMMRDQSWEDALYSSMRDLLSPFFGVDMSAGAIFEAISNKKDSGGRVYNENDSVIDQTIDIADHMRKALQPGIAGNIERLTKASMDVKKSSGQPYSMEDELVALAGWRASTIDIKTALYYRSFEFTDALAEARREITLVMRSPNHVSGDDVRDSYAAAQRKQDEAFKKMSRLVSSAEAAGLSRTEIIRTLRLSNIAQGNIAALMREQSTPVSISSQAASKAIQQAMVMNGPEFAQEVRDRFRQIPRSNLIGERQD